MRVLDIIPGTSVDGPGLRTSIYLAGCRHNCPGCHNPQSWDFENGVEMSADDIFTVIKQHDFNVTFTGGDPIYHSQELLPLAKKIKDVGYTIWLYTGFLMEDLLDMPVPHNLLEFIDVLVDGPYIEALRDMHLPFRGSSNQRVIDVKHTLESPDNKIIELNFDTLLYNLI